MRQISASAAREATVLASLHTGSCMAYAAAVAEALTDLGSRPSDERRERAAILSAMSSNPFVTRPVRASWASGSRLGDAAHGGLHEADPGPARRRLRPLEQRGVLAEGASDHREREAWVGDMDALRAPDVVASQGVAFATMDNAKAALRPRRRHMGWALRPAAGARRVDGARRAVAAGVLDRPTHCRARAPEAMGRRTDVARTVLGSPGQVPRGRSSPSEDGRLRKGLDRCRGKVT